MNDDHPLLKEIAYLHESIPAGYEDWQPTDLDYLLREESLKLLMQHEGDQILAIVEEELIAFIWYKMTDHTHIKSLWVDPRRRGQGYASRLKNEVKRMSEAQGMAYIKGTVHPANRGMVALNKKLGYNWVGKEMRLEL
ncbi:GNAT family N-acetyltransferase [Macrococcus bovicus]|uniref:GNAT family N-acetyltransferase n=1 Tax=Macrococcus bovicus TaxID=69968 RepID=UPI0025A4D551|nr:GNAT family N-acetyltransferase [Macrococcus bovicus]WJP98241.1 GNAT family N-acetyltransferase [Macrococcus bovicus]